VKRYVSYCVALGLAVCIQNPDTADQTSSNNSAGQVFSDSKTGRVGIGTTKPAATLDVYQGEIKIGSTGAPCTKDLAGALRSTNSELQFCDGAAWRNVGLDKAQ
jgi:hypothetical protein